MPTNGFSNMNDIMSMIKSGNPQQMAVKMLEQTASSGDPLAQNLLFLVNSGNPRQIEAVARNIAKEKGIDFDKEFNSFKQMFRL